MAVISPSNNTLFKDSSIIVSTVKRFLKSYNAFNLIPEEEFYRYIYDVLSALGIGVLKEEQSLVYIQASKGVLPFNFKSLYAAYRVTPSFSQMNLNHEQSNSSVMTTDITQEIITRANKCEIECCETNAQILEKVTIKNFVNEGALLIFTSPNLLRLSPNVKKTFIEDDSPCLFSKSSSEITIDGNFLYTNFDKGTVFMKYYGFPLDKESGLPLIPNINSVEKAIEYYLRYQTLLQLWYNNDVPDLQAKWQKAEADYELALEKAKYEDKLPTFQAMTDKAFRNKRNLSIYQI